MERAESIGYVRHSVMMMAKAAEEVQREWEEGELILTPRQSAELAQLLTEARKQVAAVAEYSKKFEQVAEVRRVPIQLAQTA